MALRAVPDHPKFAHLKSLLRMPKGAALGYLECVWHFAGRFTPQGNIGKYADTAIEAWVEWDGEPGYLIEALVESRWIDRDDFFRLLVHDWSSHADKATKQALTRANLKFCVPTVHTPVAHNAVLSTLPVPVPVPVPGAQSSENSFPPPEVTARTAVEQIRGFDGAEWFEEVYTRHPKKKDRGLAQNYLSEVAAAADFSKDEFDRVHKLWCVEWSNDKPQFVSTLSQWILDKGWKYPPGVEKNGSTSQQKGEAYQPYVDPFKHLMEASNGKK